MKNIRIDILLIPLVSLFFYNSCSVTKPNGFFYELVNDTAISSITPPQKQFIISKGDILGINVSSLNTELDSKFNSSQKSMSSINPQPDNAEGIIVDNSGDIVLHFLGKLHVEGLTSTALKEKLENDLIAYLKDPIVTVKILNRKVTVFGEVGSPKILVMNNESMTLLDALVLSGDINENANIKDIMIIRDSSAVKTVKHINLKDHSIFDSPWYYLQYNDIVYVNRDYKRVDKSESRKNLQTTLSVIVSLVSLTITIINILAK